jgi:DNA-binding transcriptional LysR family regulator
MSRPLDARLLLTFRAVVSAGRISGAARALHLSQPAVTAQIRQLEDQCGVALLVRSARGVTPTTAGRELLVYADRLESLLDEAVATLGGHSHEGGELVLGASTTIASYVLPELLAEFVRSTPNVSVRVEVGNSERIMELVSSGSIRLGLVEGLTRAPRLRIEPFLSDELVPVIAADAPAALRQLRRAEDLLRAPIIWREPGSGTRLVVERAIKKALGNRPRVPGDLEIGATEGIIGAVTAGLGVAFLSRWSIRTLLALGRLRVLPLTDFTISRNFSFTLPAATIGGMPGRFLKFARLAAPRLKP